MTKNYRTDADGKRGATKCATACTCKKPKRDRSQLAKPVVIDAARIDALKQIAEAVFCFRTSTFIADGDRQDMLSVIRLIDGDVPQIPADAAPNMFVAGIYLGALNRRGYKTAYQKHVAPKAPKAKRSDERAAREEFAKQSRDAWKRNK